MSELSAFLALSPFVIFLIFLALLFDFLKEACDYLDFGHLLACSLLASSREIVFSEDMRNSLSCSFTAILYMRLMMSS